MIQRDRGALQRIVKSLILLQDYRRLTHPTNMIID